MSRTHGRTATGTRTRPRARTRATRSAARKPAARKPAARKPRAGTARAGTRARKVTPRTTRSRSRTVSTGAARRPARAARAGARLKLRTAAGRTMDARRRRGAPRWDVFVSYAHKDGKRVAERIEEGLVRRGLRVWRDDTGLKVGDKIFDSIMRAMEGSAYVVAVISPEYVKRASTMIEVGGMLQGKHRNRILPVLYKTKHAEVGAKLPMLFDTLMRDWDDGDFESLLDEIARTVGGSGRGRGRTARPGGARTGRARGGTGDGRAGASRGGRAGTARKSGPRTARSPVRTVVRTVTRAVTRTVTRAGTGRPRTARSPVRTVTRTGTGRPRTTRSGSRPNTGGRHGGGRSRRRSGASPRRGRTQQGDR